MSVLINMEIPRGCYECPLKHRGFNGEETVSYCYVACKEVPEDGKRDADCPLVPMPAHGLVIDTDELKPYMLNEHYKYRLVYDADEVANTSTIIPPEEGEE